MSEVKWVAGTVLLDGKEPDDEAIVYVGGDCDAGPEAEINIRGKDAGDISILIAAAPEMLTALRSARSTLDRLYEGFLHNSEAGCEAWDDASGFEVGRQLDAVIAKAEGRQP